MRKPIPSHGNLDHFYLSQHWTGLPRPREAPPLMIGSPAQFRAAISAAIAQIDAINNKQPLHIPMEDIEL